MSNQEWRNRKLYGTCTACGTTLDENRWQVGEERTGIYYCCSESCAQYIFETSEEAWDRSMFGDCPSCGRPVRNRTKYGVDVLDGDNVLTTIWTCGERCARSVSRKMSGKRGGLFSWLGL